MRNFSPKLKALCLALAFGLPMSGAWGAATAPNNPPDLGGTPPDLTQSVDPNIILTFDDSGSRKPDGEPSTDWVDNYDR